MIYSSQCTIIFNSQLFSNGKHIKLKERNSLKDKTHFKEVVKIIQNIISNYIFLIYSVIYNDFFFMYRAV